MNKGKPFKLPKGSRGRAKNCISIASEHVEKALQYSYRDQRNKKKWQTVSLDRLHWVSINVWDFTRKWVSFILMLKRIIKKPSRIWCQTFKLLLGGHLSRFAESYELAFQKALYSASLFVQEIQLELVCCPVHVLSFVAYIFQPLIYVVLCMYLFMYFCLGYYMATL